MNDKWQKWTIVVLSVTTLVLAGTVYLDRWTMEAANEIFNASEVMAKGGRIRHYQIIRAQIDSGDLDNAMKRLDLITQMEIDGVKAMTNEELYPEGVTQVARGTLFRAENQTWEEPISPDVEETTN